MRDMDEVLYEILCFLAIVIMWMRTGGVQVSGGRVGAHGSCKNRLGRVMEGRKVMLRGMLQSGVNEDPQKTCELFMKNIPLEGAHRLSILILNHVLR